MGIISGIYVLFYEDDSEDFYVGMSVNIQERYNKHCSELKKGTHHNYLLQNYYDIYKMPPNMEVLEVVTDVNVLASREIYWIDEFDSFTNGMNLVPGGSGSNGADNNYAKYYKEVYLKILEELVNTDKRLVDISAELGVSNSVVKTIASCSAHRYLKGLYPELYLLLEKRRGTRSKRIYSEEVYRNILYKLAYTKDTLLSISIELEVSKYIVGDISAGKAHTYLKDMYPGAYATMLSKGNRKAGPTDGTKYPSIKSPGGIIYEITNTTEFAKIHGLDQPNLHALLSGRRKSHKGWTLA